jgi:hypothetical protein
MPKHRLRELIRRRAAVSSIVSKAIWHTTMSVRLYGAPGAAPASGGDARAVLARWILLAHRLGPELERLVDRPHGVGHPVGGDHA